MKRTAALAYVATVGFLLVGTSCVAEQVAGPSGSPASTVTRTATVISAVTPTVPPTVVSTADLTATAQATVVTPTPVESPDPGPADEHTALAEVDSVTDGDTIRVFVDGYSTAVRILGIDTAETVNVNPDECYGAEASAKVHDLLDGTAVILTVDPTQGTGPERTDKYGRWLRYVTTGDTGEDVSAFLLRYGYARYVEFDGPLERSDIYRAAQDEAKTNHIGGWAECGW